MPLHSKISGSWQKVSLPMTRVSGTWKPAKQVWTKVNGEWKKIFDLETADPFDGSGNLDGQETPGYAPWKVYRGSWSKSGGLVTAGALNSVAGIETGISENIEIEIDMDDAAKSGSGTAFWIQDQNNWWGAQTFYQAYSFTNSPTTTFYNYSCTGTNYVVSSTTTPGTPASYSYTFTSYTSYAASGAAKNYAFGSRTCRANGTMSAYTAAPGGTGCTLDCVEFNAPAVGAPCNSPNTVYPIINCGTTCTFCTLPSPMTNSGNGTGPNCPSDTTFFGSLCSGTVGSITYVDIGPCTFIPGTAGVTNCSHAVGTNFGPFVSNSVSFDARTYTAPCVNSVSYSCVPSYSSITTPGNVVNSVTKQTRLIRSVGGTVSEVPGTINNIGDGNNIGGMVTRITPTQVRVTAYSGASRTGTTFPVQTYSIPSGTSKGTKHGIVVSGTPTSQTYSISRFKATMI